jgi:hypothetical protein
LNFGSIITAEKEGKEEFVVAKKIAKKENYTILRRVNLFEELADSRE